MDPEIHEPVWRVPNRLAKDEQNKVSAELLRRALSRLTLAVLTGVLVLPLVAAIVVVGLLSALTLIRASLPVRGHFLPTLTLLILPALLAALMLVRIHICHLQVSPVVCPKKTPHR